MNTLSDDREDDGTSPILSSPLTTLTSGPRAIGTPRRRDLHTIPRVRPSSFSDYQTRLSAAAVRVNADDATSIGASGGEDRSVNATTFEQSARKLPSDPINDDDDGEDEQLYIEWGSHPVRRCAAAMDAASSNPDSTRLLRGGLRRILSQIPAVVLICMFHLMIGIPFGVSYFPIGWSSSGSNGATTNTSSDDDDDGIRGTFPVPGKEALGIRMFLFSTIVGQVAFTAASGFNNPIGLQMVENVPFCHALCHIVIARQGYGADALSTLFVMFGLSSIVVGAVFYTLGRLELGRVVYYFPTHVLVGCIGGIGIFIAKTGIEVTIDAVFALRSISDNLNLLVPVLCFELLLRVLERATLDIDGNPRFSLLSPIYFCLITPVFYAILWFLRVDMLDAAAAGYFFPSLAAADCDGADSCSASTLHSIFNKDLLVMWRLIDLSVVSWPAIADAIPTLVALTLFSLIHVPINIPAFAISTGTDADMNRELVAHGYSNIAAGLFGGLQNYSTLNAVFDCFESCQCSTLTVRTILLVIVAYTQSVVYDRSGGKGKVSGIAVAVATTLLFFVGPTIAMRIPRCMAGTLLIHVGIDLFLEGVYDSIGKFDHLEYAGIWLITVVMTTYGMDAAMIAGGIAAVSTHAVQSIHYVNPIRGTMSASTLRSSVWNRNNDQRVVLDNERVGRNRILVVQLQGHLFFGNMAMLIKEMNRLLSEKAKAEAAPWIVILDFSLVLGIDSSAARTMTKLRKILQNSFHVDLCIFVSGSDDGFPCQFDLSAEIKAASYFNSMCEQSAEVESFPDETTPILRQSNSGNGEVKQRITGSHIKGTLDLALIFAEDALLARQGLSASVNEAAAKSSDERELALQYLANLCPGEVERANIALLFSYFEREVYNCDDLLWSQGSPSDCTKLLVQGRLIAMLENEAGTSEVVTPGNTIGELGLLQGLPRMSSVKCLSEKAVVYSLSRESFEKLCQVGPQAARLMDLICIRYLSARVQHVSNRIFETRCLPV